MIKYLAILLIAFFIYNFILLDKYPLVTPDETWFANYAYSLTGKETLSSFPFENRLPKIDESSRIAYGPVYSLLLSIPLKFLPYGITTLRLTSVIISALTLFTLFILIKYSLKSSALALLSSMLLSVDYYFLIRARFVRPETLIVLFSTLAIYFYLKSKPLLTGIFICLSIFSHYFNGLIPLITISVHYLLNRKPIMNKKFLLIILPSLIFSFVWLYYLSSKGLDADGAWQLIFSKRIAPNFQLIASFPIWEFPRKNILVVQLITFFLLLISKTSQNDVKKLFLIYFLTTTAFFFYGNSLIYEALLALPTVLCLAAIRHRFIFPALFTTAAILNISFQIFALIFIANYSYASFAKNISHVLTPNSKVLLKHVNPDPYLYLAEHRPDIKIDYFQAVDKKNYQESLVKADYIITHGYDLKYLEEYQKNRHPQSHPFDQSLIDFLEKNRFSVTSFETPVYVYNIVVIKIQK